MFLIFHLFLWCIFFLILSLSWRYFRNWTTLWHLPSIKNYPMIGCAFAFIGRKAEDSIEILMKLIGTVKGPVKLFLGPTLHVFITDPEDVKAILTSPNCVEKHEVYKFFNLGSGLITSPSFLWRSHRKLFNPCFNTKVIQTLIPIFNDKSKILVNILRSKIGCDTFDVIKFIHPCTLELICQTTLGFNIDVQNGKNLSYLEAIEKLSELVSNRFFKIWLHNDFIYSLTHSYAEDQMCRKIMNDLTDKILEENQKNSLTEISERRPKILINQMLQFLSSGNFTVQDIRDNIDTMVIAGYDTSALTISHVLLMLAIHSDIQERVFGELQAVCGSRESDITSDIISQLNYLEMVIKETLRLFLVAPVLGRKTLKNVPLKSCTLPSDTSIVIFAYHLHRNPDIWGPNADKFDPDNFLPERVSKRHPYSYIPFSGGSRNCLGMKYAMTSVKIILATLLRHFIFKTNLRLEELQPSLSISLKIKQKDMVRIEPRQEW